MKSGAAGFRFAVDGENFRVEKVNCYQLDFRNRPVRSGFDRCQSHANTDLVDLIPPLLHERTMLLTLQNGLGNEEFLADHFGAERVLGGLCFICLSRTSRTTVERYDYGHIVIWRV